MKIFVKKQSQIQWIMDSIIYDGKLIQKYANIGLGFDFLKPF